MTWREISAKQLNDLKNVLIIDVRSPSEHQAEFIPDSINVPLLSDAQRAEVGTVYVQQGEALARRLALKLVAPQAPAMVDRILSLKDRHQAIVVHCWRGGLRSEAVASFLSVVGLDCFRLTGGYKAWRRQLIEEMEEADWLFTPIVLDGLTGSGKTDILKELEKLGHAVLDLEGLANHRGSVFGGMGLAAQPTQKNFEAAIWRKIRTLGRQPVFMEAESRKIGKLAVPLRLISAMQTAPRIIIECSLEARKQRIVADYTDKLDETWRNHGFKMLSMLKERLGAKATAEIIELFEAGNHLAGVERLLLDYYDPLYKRHIEKAKPFKLVVSGDDPRQLAAQIAETSMVP